MKTTSEENSRKLAEIGFKNYKEAATSYKQKQPAYGLETILEALQEKLPCNIKITMTEIEIENRPLFESPSMQFQFWEEKIERLDNESLADTTARLLILLHEKGIVKFNN